MKHPVWLLVLLFTGWPALAQFGPQQTQFKNSVTAMNGTIDVHGVASGTVTGPGGSTVHYTTDQHVSGTLTLDHYNPLTGALVGTLDGTITISETSVVSFGCTVTNTLSANSSAATDFLGQPLVFNLWFDIGSDTWSLWPSNESINGTNKSVQDCAGQTSTSTATNPMRFMPINMSMGFPFSSSGFDLAGTRQVNCSGCGNADGNPVSYTFTYNLKATTKDCSYALQAASVNLAPGATSGTINITAGAGCPWVALPLNPWITIVNGSGSGSGTVSFSVTPNTSGATRSGAISVGGLTVTIIQPGSCAVGAPVINSVTSLSDFGGFLYFASGSWLEIKGSNLAGTTRLWGSADFQGPNAPISLDGSSVKINGQAAFVEYISPSQVNVQAPADPALGTVAITLTNCAGTSVAFPTEKRSVVPGILAPPSFQWGSVQLAVAQFPDGAYVGPPGLIPGVAFRYAKAGDVITLYGIGFGDVAPVQRPGVVAQQNSMSNVSFNTAFSNALSYAGLSPGQIGLYQFNIAVQQVDSDGGDVSYFAVVDPSGNSSRSQNFVIEVQH